MFLHHNVPVVSRTLSLFFFPIVSNFNSTVSVLAGVVSVLAGVVSVLAGVVSVLADVRYVLSLQHTSDVGL